MSVSDRSSFSQRAAALNRRKFLGGAAALTGSAMTIRGGTAAMAQDGAQSFSAAELEQIDQVATGFLTESGTPGAIVGIWIPERGTVVKAYGVSDIESGVAPTELDTFRIASNTKTYVATLLLQLVDEGLVSLDTPLSDFDFDFPKSESATIAQLLDMTSGIFSYTEDEGFMANYIADPMMAFTPEDALAIARTHDPYFAPGEGIHYSDTNYILAGTIAEQVTGSRVEQLIRDRFVLPYFLSGTSFPADAAMPDPHMSGYAPATSDRPMLDATESQPGISWAAGAMISNLDDMHTWVELLTDGSLLTPELQTQRMQQIIPMAEGSPIQYGLGLMELFGFYGHNGGIAGYSTIMLRDPDDGATFVAVTNLSDEHGGGADTIVLSLIQLLLPERIPAPATPPVASPAASPVS